MTTPAGAAITQAKALLPPAQHILDNTSQTSDLLLDSTAITTPTAWRTA